jgi:hypothetical protein
LRSCIDTIDTPPDDTFLPLFEALNWAVALSDLAKKTGTAIAIPPDELLGLRFARNRVHHGWGQALEVGDVLWPQPLVMTNRPGGSRLIGPVVVKAWVWLPARRPPRGWPQLTLRAAYVRKLQGQQAHGVLERLAAGLSTLR